MNAIPKKTKNINLVTGIALRTVVDSQSNRKQHSSKGKPNECRLSLNPTARIQQYNKSNSNQPGKVIVAHCKQNEEKENRQIKPKGPYNSIPDQNENGKKKTKKKISKLKKHYISSKSDSKSKQKNHSVSRDKSRQKSKPKCNTSRSLTSKMKKSECMKSTKLVTERSYFKQSVNITRKQPFRESLNSKGNKKQKKTHKNPASKRVKSNVGNSEEERARQQQESAPQTFRRRQLRIKTEFSQRKTSFFDEDLLEKLNVKCTESVQEGHLSLGNNKRVKTTNFELDSLNQRFDYRMVSRQNQRFQKTFSNLDYSRKGQRMGVDQQIQTERQWNTENGAKQPGPSILLSNFKKIQGLRWKVMLLELDNLRGANQIYHEELSRTKKNLLKERTIKKIDQMILETNSNRVELMEETEQLLQDKRFRNRYAFEHPFAVQEALISHGSSQSSQRALIDQIKEPSADNIRTEDQGRDFFDFNDQTPIPHRYFEAEQFKFSSNLSEELQKELEQYSSADFGKNKQHQRMQENQVQISELQNIENKRLLTLEITDLLIKEAAQELVMNKKILHGFLAGCLNQTEVVNGESNPSSKNRSPEKKDENKMLVENSFFQFKIECDKAYSVELLTRLLDFIETQPAVRSRLLHMINTPFGNDPLKMLKWVRQYYEQQQQELYSEQNRAPPKAIVIEQQKQEINLNQSEEQAQQQPEDQIATILTHEILNDFEAKNMNQLVHQQYFYNHCVYNCINELLDSMRPYGLSGKPCFCLKSALWPRKTEDYLEVVAQLARQFIQLINNRVGSQSFQLATQGQGVSESSAAIAKRNYELLDRLAVKQEESKWADLNDYFFQNKYHLSQRIMEELFLEETRMFMALGFSG